MCLVLAIVILVLLVLAALHFNFFPFAGHALSGVPDALGSTAMHMFSGPGGPVLTGLAWVVGFLVVLWVPPLRWILIGVLKILPTFIRLILVEIFRPL